PVGIAELRVDPFASATRHVLCETKMPQHADAVRLQREAGADLGQRGGLLVDPDLNVALVQRIGGSQATDTAADDCHMKRSFSHELAAVLPRVIQPWRPRV